MADNVEDDATALPFANDGSFMEMFLKEQEEEKNKERLQEKASTTEEKQADGSKAKAEDPSFTQDDTRSSKQEPAEGKATPAIVILKKTGLILRNKPIVAVRSRPETSAAPSGKRRKADEEVSESAYLTAMRKFKSQACSDDAASSRPLLK
mmetsp:Transcript_1215/g.2146  ORF Transcript_1215/g.2146 Transcript_1215/m.2146 type:complete len:151 (-) Transcript_1215:156-608(-)|eukprot:CAMPEP_0198209044 /NCGR_PEP_ID=MMETSP1445-20131203/12369_1 /TAXON_ID=36898 /ORGANISM="Pyramimonas sp., Strain CCMP2087" /LENGTH=150 /DNA_ID=CAMNT_0043882673 /DNA_START=238 /DNA_END=690 /DNA_ORIENTATION=-